MTEKIDLNKYSQFVAEITSAPSNNLEEFTARTVWLTSNVTDSVFGPDINVPLVMTCAMGMSGEAGEFSEIFKKVIFHGKPYTEETKAHASKELGDVIWYWTNACRALGLDPNQVIADNVTKLEGRYPGGKFDAFASDNRASGDI